MRITGMTQFVMIAGFSLGPAAVQNGSVRNRVNCDAPAGMTVPATAIGPRHRNAPCDGTQAARRGARMASSVHR
jgi:hypothetical protein